MAQTTEAMNFCAADVEVSDDNVTWHSLSGHGAAIAETGGDRVYGTVYTFDGDTSINLPGKRTPRLVTFRGWYTEEATDGLFAWLLDIYEAACGGTIYVRWFPKGNIGAGEFVFETGKTFISSLRLPVGESSSAEGTVMEFTVPCASVTKSAYTSP